MFKGTNKFWKGLALLLVLCMLPTVALASETNTITVEGDWVKVNEEGSNVTVTVTGSISDAEADVTILAVRDAGEVTLATVGTWSNEMLKNKVVYIDQESFDGGNFEFNFIPKSGVKGGKLTVFVGGKNVSEVKSMSKDAAVAAPDVVPVTPWYQGTPLQLNIYKAGTTEAYGDETAVKGWFDDINSFTVNGGTPLATTGEGAPVTRLGNVITVTGVTATEQAPLTAIAITTDANSYKEETWAGSVKQDPKLAGTLAAEAVISGNPVVITATENALDHDWADKLNAATWSYKTASTEYASFDTEEVGVVGSVVTITSDKLFVAKDTVTYTIKAEIANYEFATVDVAITSPATADAEDVAVSVDYKGVSGAYVAEDYQVTQENWGTEGTDYKAGKEPEAFGKAYIELDIKGANGSTITWTTTDTDVQDAINAAVEAAADDATKVEVILERPAKESTEPSKTIALTATVSNGTYTPVVVDNLTAVVNKIGLSGVEVTITLSMPNSIDPAVKAANKVTVEGNDATTADGLVFTATMNEGDNTVVLSNEFGYVTRTFKVKVTGETVSLVTPTGKKVIGTVSEKNVTVAMIPGDETGDGQVLTSDFGPWKTALFKKAGEAGYNKRVDFDGNGDITTADFGFWKTNLFHNENDYKE